MLHLHAFHDVVHANLSNLIVELGHNHVSGHHLDGLEEGHGDAIRHDNLYIASDLHGRTWLWQDELCEALIGFLCHRNLRHAILGVYVAEHILVQGIEGALTVN